MKVRTTIMTMAAVGIACLLSAGAHASWLDDLLVYEGFDVSGASGGDSDRQTLSRAWSVALSTELAT